QFQFTSQRHLGFPFSATIFVNGIMAARISSCCEPQELLQTDPSKWRKTLLQ
ncbi:hypothetical protein M9458_011038, partial [Cirrhinus mrigala]